MNLSRTDRSLLTAWWFTVDRVLLTTILVLVGTGVVLSLAASPAVAIKKGLPAFYFVERHVLFALVGVVAMLAVSMLEPRQVRRLALALFVCGLGLMVAVLMSGPEINGAKRWLRLGGHSFQPSEIAKPAFVVLSAWLLAESKRRPDMPALSLAVASYLAFSSLILLQPDVGQTLLVSLVWAALFFLSGQPLVRFATLGFAGAAGLAIAYSTFPHVRSRIARFLDPSSGDTFQTDRAIESFTEGGLFGRGPGEGTIKNILPDAHTDFIFAVVGEEYGTLACLAIVALFGFIVFRALQRARNDPDIPARFAVFALALLFTLQAVINMGVNVGLVPAKGITLPFISYGGSSNLGLSLLAGMLLALTRRRPDAARVRKPSLRIRAAGLEIREPRT
jgi:cell division protein FtsW